MTERHVFVPYIRDCDMAVRSPWHAPERRLLDFLLVHIQEGECLFTVEGKELSLRAGQFCLIQPGERVELRGLTPTVTPYIHFDVFYNPHREDSFATRPGQLDLKPYAQFLQPRLDVLGVEIPTVFGPPTLNFCDKMAKLIENWRSADVLSQLQSHHALGDLILSALQQLGAAPIASRSESTLNWMPSYLSTHLSESISVADMARRAHLSPSRFHFVFYKTFGVTPGRYLSNLRVSHAAELLENTDWTMAHIADLCGFADVHHFAKTFKKLTAITPGQHRQNKRKL
jgi:AraC-like DNA-binding protein